MPVGAAISSDQANNILTAVAREMHDDMESVVKLWNWIATLGADQTAQQAALVAMPNGFSTADAATFWTKANNLFAVAQVYFGLGTQASAFNFDSALAGVRGPG
jgi:hypothetical protein